MDARIKRRMLAFYFAGFLNLVLGLYVLIYGRAMLEQGTWLILLIFFFGFAAVDFWFPRVLRRNWLEAQAQLRDEGGGVSRGFEEHAPSRRTPDAMQRDGPGSETRDQGKAGNP